MRDHPKTICGFARATDLGATTPQCQGHHARPRCWWKHNPTTNMPVVVQKAWCGVLHSLKGAAVADVVAHGAAEKARLLGDHAQLAAVPRSIQLRQVVSIHQHLAICSSSKGAHRRGIKQPETSSFSARRTSSSCSAAAEGGWDMQGARSLKYHGLGGWQDGVRCR